MRFKALPVTSLEDVTLDLEQLQTIFHALTWTAPTLLNSWANAGTNTTAGYLKDPLGFVHLRGRIVGGISGSVAFTLPAGYRPGGVNDTYPAAGVNNITPVAALANILPSGNVSIFFASAITDVGLGGISFFAES